MQYCMDTEYVSPLNVIRSANIGFIVSDKFCCNKF